MTPRRVRVTIDRIVTDDPGLSREALTRAIEAEVRTRLASGQQVGPAGARAAASAPLTEGPGNAASIARAALGVVLK